MYNKKSKVKELLTIALVTLVIGGGVFAWAWIMMDVGYGPECLVVKCVKVMH